jgi:hypothetical protein
MNLGELVFHIKGIPWVHVSKPKLKKPGGVFFSTNPVEEKLA